MQHRKVNRGKERITNRNAERIERRKYRWIEIWKIRKRKTNNKRITIQKQKKIRPKENACG